MKAFKTSIIIVLFISRATFLLAQPITNTLEEHRITYITGKIDESIKHDTLSLVLHGPFFYDGAPERGASRILTTTANRDGDFKFKILTGNSPFHISLFLSSKKNSQSGLLPGDGDIADYLIEPGDSIHVFFDTNKQDYSGKGAKLFEAQYVVGQVDKGNKILTHDHDDYFRKNIKKWLTQKDSLLNFKLGLLATYQSKISQGAYGIISADIIGVNRTWVYRRISFAGPFFVPGAALDQDLAQVCQELQQRPAYVDKSNRSALSPRYIYYLFEKLRIEVKYDRIVQHQSIYSNNNFFPVINQQYNGLLRDKLLAYWLMRLVGLNDLQPDYIANALSVMQTPGFIEIVDGLKKTYGKGRPVTDFDFKDPKDKIVHLTDFKGKVLLVDLWFSGCHGCVAVAAGLPHVEQAFKSRRDVAFISISIDKDKKVWLQSIDKNRAGRNYTHYTTTTTTYLYTGGTASANPFIMKYVPDGSYPQLLIINKDGRIFSSTPSRPVNSQLQKHLIEEINEALASK